LAALFHRADADMARVVPSFLVAKRCFDNVDDDNNHKIVVDISFVEQAPEHCSLVLAGSLNVFFNVIFQYVF
jgi:hypothetical protein